MRPRVLQEAEEELLAATLWYEDRQEGLGADFSSQVVETIARICEEPIRYALYEGKKIDRELRRAMVDRFPYLVIFEIRANEVLIVAVVHTSRRPGFWRDR